MKRIGTLLVIQATLFIALSAAGANRLAIGTLGMAPEKRDADLADLIAVRLSAVLGFELVERRELDAILKEAGLGRSGMVRAKDAIRLGALLRADNFLLGTSATISETNRLVVRLVNGRTGVIEAISVFPSGGPLDSLAAEIAKFVQTESAQPRSGRRDYLAIGVIQNLGVNNRFPDFPAQMRATVPAQLNGKVTVLERDVISFLANEVRMDMAGLTEGTPEQATQMQFGFWIVDGFYQSYEVGAPEVQLKLRIERVQGTQQSSVLQGKPTEDFFTRICKTIEKAVSNPAEPEAKPPTRHGEIEALQARAEQLIEYYYFDSGLVRSVRMRSSYNPDKYLNAVEEATRLFESILLLDPGNNAARMRLAGCHILDTQKWGGVERDHGAERAARAEDLYREVIATGEAEIANDARISLARLVGGLEGVEMLRCFANETSGPKEKTRIQQYRSVLLSQQAHRVPLEALMPHLRKQLLDELTDVERGLTELPLVTYDEVLSPWRFDAVKRSQIVNALLPEIIEKFHDLKPYILLVAAGEQCDTNSPVITQFFESLKYCEQHPETVRMPTCYFAHLSSTLEEEKEVRERGGLTLLQRTFERNQFATVIVASLARERAAAKGLAPPLSVLGKTRLAESYMALQQWNEALGLFNELTNATPQMRNECRRHLGLAPESEAVPDSAWTNKSDIIRVEVAYECMGRQQWDTAISILDSMKPRTVRMNRGGPWGGAFVPVLPAVVADECRAKAGKPALKEPMRFEIGDKPYVGFEPQGPRLVSFEVEGEDLWLAMFSQVKRFRGEGPFIAGKPLEYFEFERKTQSANTCICVCKNYIWGGTEDDGLLELNRRTGVRRRFTMSDGLLLNGISGLKLLGQTLWIAYRNGADGAVGTLDLTSHKFSALTGDLAPGRSANPVAQSDQPIIDDLNQAPHRVITAMAATRGNDMWFAVKGKGLQRFRIAERDWCTFLQPFDMMDMYFPAMVANPTHERLLLAKREYDLLGGAKSRNGGLVIYDYRQNKAEAFRIYEGLPSNDLWAVAVDGNMAWIGGRGFVAVLDIEAKKVLRVAYVSANQIRDIKLDHDHAWISISTSPDGYWDHYGSARTGIYRLSRASIEPRALASQR